MRVFDILLNLIETVTELNGLEYTEGNCESYFKPCYTAHIECLEGVESLTLKIPSFFQAVRYNNAAHVSEATFIALYKKYMATIPGNATAKMVKRDMKKLHDISYSDVCLVLWLDGLLTCNPYGFANPITRDMFDYLGNDFKNEMYYTIIHDTIDFYNHQDTLSQALKAHESETDFKKKRKIEISRTPNGYESNVAIFLRNHYLHAATASNIHKIREWEFLKDQDVFTAVLRNAENEELFKTPYNDKFTYYDKLCEEVFEDIVGAILEECHKGRNDFENVQVEVDSDFVHCYCSQEIEKYLCSSVESTRVYLNQLMVEDNTEKTDNDLDD